ncbi:MAG: dephospho-CoA kinase [Candidatus Izemoplasmatales bacterium]|nr:dephospho-CoA kinase [Candidatus Izemoplasmatales bacterium]
MKVIGLTGGIASGKSVIAGWFRDENIPLIEADEVYKQLTKPGNLLYNEITKLVPSGMISPSGEILWQELALKAFTDDVFRQRLNHITHPVVQEEILGLIASYREKKVPCLVVSVPLLFESGFDAFCDVTICVYVPYDVQIQRLMERDQIDRAYAQVKIDAQASLEEKKLRATYVIDNAQSFEATRNAFQWVLDQLRRG